MNPSLSRRLLIFGFLIATLTLYNQIRPNNVEACSVTRSSPCDELRAACNGDFTCSNGEAICATTENESPSFGDVCLAIGGDPSGEHDKGRSCDF
jgi:hypothetical protein